MAPVDEKLLLISHTLYIRILDYEPVLEASKIPNGLRSFMKELILLGLAQSSMMTESEETSTTLPSKRRASSVKARR